MKSKNSFDIKYAFFSHIPQLKSNGWDVCGYAGHIASDIDGVIKPVLLVKRPSQGVAIRNKRKAHKTMLRRLKIDDGLMWRG